MFNDVRFHLSVGSFAYHIKQLCRNYVDTLKDTESEIICQRWGTAYQRRCFCIVIMGWDCVSVELRLLNDLISTLQMTRE
jgi:hypothetical protein